MNNIKLVARFQPGQYWRTFDHRHLVKILSCDEIVAAKAIVVGLDIEVIYDNVWIPSNNLDRDESKDAPFNPRTITRNGYLYLYNEEDAPMHEFALTKIETDPRIILKAELGQKLCFGDI